VAVLSTLLSVVLAIALSRPANKAMPMSNSPNTSLQLTKAPESPQTAGTATEPALAQPLVGIAVPTPIEGTHSFVVHKGGHEVTVTNSKVIASWSVYVRPGATVKKQYTFRGKK